MLSSTRGIVLRAVKFRENSLIVTVYTETYGRQTYIINDARGSRARNKAAFFQPLFIVDLEVYMKKERDLQRIKESRLAVPFVSVPFDISKSSQVIFLAEVLYRILREEECNPELYRFIENALIFLDITDKKTAGFHCWFLANLTAYLGILPNTSESENGWLDMQKGIIVNKEPPHPAFMNPETTDLLIKLTNLNISELTFMTIHKKQRKLLLMKLLEYYNLHFETLGTLHTLSVLKEVFE